MINYAGLGGWAQSGDDSGNGYTGWISTTIKGDYYIAFKDGNEIKYFIGHNGNFQADWTGRAGLAYDWWDKL